MQHVGRWTAALATAVTAVTLVVIAPMQSSTAASCTAGPNGTPKVKVVGHLKAVRARQPQIRIRTHWADHHRAVTVRGHGTLRWTARGNTKTHATYTACADGVAYPATITALKTYNLAARKAASAKRETRSRHRVRPGRVKRMSHTVSRMVRKHSRIRAVRAMRADLRDQARDWTMDQARLRATEIAANGGVTTDPVEPPTTEPTDPPTTKPNPKYKVYKMTDWERAVGENLLSLINAERASLGRDQLVWRHIFDKGTFAWAKHIAPGYLSGQMSDPHDHDLRGDMDVEGCPPFFLPGENIAAASVFADPQATAQDAFEMWKISPPHYSSMTNANIHMFSIGLGYNPDVPDQVAVVVRFRNDQCDPDVP